MKTVISANSLRSQGGQNKVLLQGYYRL